MAAPVLITELAFPTHRAPITAMYNSSWYLGSIVAAWVTYGTFRIPGTWSWRIPSLLQGLPSIIQVALVFVVIPESPRWLIAQGRDEEALKTLIHYHCAGDENDPLAHFEYQEIKTAIQIDAEINRATTYKSLFTTPGNRRRMLAIIPYSFFSQWSGVSLLSSRTLVEQLLIYNPNVERYSIILPQSRLNRRRYHLSRLSKLNQRCPPTMERRHRLRRITHRRSSRTSTSLDHKCSGYDNRLHGNHRRFSHLRKIR
jgi:hypothetical protein